MSPAAERWSSVLADADRSGLSLRAFARREGLNPSTLAWWRWNLKREQGEHAVRLAEVVLVDDAPQPAPLHVRIGEADILVHEDTDLQLGRRVVEALR